MESDLSSFCGFCLPGRSYDVRVTKTGGFVRDIGSRGQTPFEEENPGGV